MNWIGFIIAAVGLVGILAYFVQLWWSARVFEKQYAAFKRQQRENRRRFFEETKNWSSK